MRGVSSSSLHQHTDQQPRSTAATSRLRGVSQATRLTGLSNSGYREEMAATRKLSVRNVSSMIGTLGGPQLLNSPRSGENSLWLCNSLGLVDLDCSTDRTDTTIALLSNRISHRNVAHCKKPPDSRKIQRGFWCTFWLLKARKWDFRVSISYCTSYISGLYSRYIDSTYTYTHTQLRAIYIVCDIDTTH